MLHRAGTTVVRGGTVSLLGPTIIARIHSTRCSVTFHLVHAWIHLLWFVFDAETNGWTTPMPEEYTAPEPPPVPAVEPKEEKEEEDGRPGDGATDRRSVRVRLRIALRTSEGAAARDGCNSDLGGYR